MWYRGGITFREFREEMSGTTPVFGRNKKIKISFSGDKAEVKGNEIIFPSMPPTTVLDYETVSVYRGWVDHEASLIRYANMTTYNSYADVKKKQPVLYNLFETIEGIRTEAHYNDLYPGAAKNLGALGKKIAEKALDQDFKGQELIAPAIGLFARGRNPSVYNWSTERDMKAVVDRDKIEEYINEIATLTTTTESFEMAKRIIEDNGGEEEQDDQDEEGDGEGKQDGSDGAGTPEFRPGEGRAISIEDMISEIIPGNVKINYDNGDFEYRVLTYDEDKVSHWSNTDYFPEQLDLYSLIKSEIESTVSVLKKRLELLIQAKRKVEWEGLKERGRFDSKRLVGAYQGEQNVFKVREDASDLDTAVTILVDVSGSMGGNGKCELATQTCVILSECLSKIGVPFEILAFDTAGLRLRDYKKDFPPGTKFGRMDAIRHWEFKRFQDRIFDARKYLGNMDASRRRNSNLGFNSNADGESVDWAAGRLQKRTEKRKILFVLSDGMPSCHTHSNNVLSQNLKDVVEQISKNIDVVGIGIMDNAVKKFYPKNVVVNDVNDLPTTCLNLLKEALLPSKKKKAA